MKGSTHKEVESALYLKSEQMSIALKSREGSTVHKLPSFHFVESSNYFIDILKDDFCEQKADGWFELKEPVDMSNDELQKELSPITEQEDSGN